MPELPECKIMSDFINKSCDGRTFNSIYKVEKGNYPSLFSIQKFTVKSESNGKEIVITLTLDSGDKLMIYCFMGMNGNWKLVDTENWNQTNYCRLRFDSEDGKSLLLHGGYMGPKFKIGERFTGTKRGPDPVKEYNQFKLNILSNLDKSEFNKPLCEVLLNQKYFNGVGAYLTAEIVGRLDLNPYMNFNELNHSEIDKLLKMIVKCCEESYKLGGGELRDWDNPFGQGSIDEWIQFYGVKEKCFKQRFGTRNIWIKNKWKNSEQVCGI
jgi:endonuclease VIII-like 1